uniref:DUF834 domain-containing protein n=2 Tax=Oryza meridionalis TaxID=40149 RepID=A0A0E0CY46_9ORYZ
MTKFLIISPCPTLYLRKSTKKSSASLNSRLSVIKLSFNRKTGYNHIPNVTADSIWALPISLFFSSALHTSSLLLFLATGSGGEELGAVGEDGRPPDGEELDTEGRCGGRGRRPAGEELGGGAQARTVASLSSTGRPHLLDDGAWGEGSAGWCAAVGDVVTELNRSPDREELGVEDRCGGHGRRPTGEELGGGAQARAAVSPSSTGRPHLLDDGAWGEGSAGRCARPRAASSPSSTSHPHFLTKEHARGAVVVAGELVGDWGVWRWWLASTSRRARRHRGGTIRGSFAWLESKLERARPPEGTAPHRCRCPAAVVMMAAGVRQRPHRRSWRLWWQRVREPPPVCRSSPPAPRSSSHRRLCPPPAPS